MASSVAVQHFRARRSFQMWDHDPDSASAKIVTPDADTTKRSADIRGYSRFICAAMSTVTTTGITKLEIVAYSDSALSANATVVKDSGTVAADAQGDWVIEECTAEEVAQLSAEAGLAPGAGLRYLVGRITLGNAGDEAAVVYIREGGVEYLNQTPATTIA